MLQNSVSFLYKKLHKSIFLQLNEKALVAKQCCKELTEVRVTFQMSCAY